MSKIIEKHRRRKASLVESIGKKDYHTKTSTGSLESRAIAVRVCPADMAQLRVEAGLMTVEQLLHEYKALEADPIIGSCIWSLRYYFNQEEGALYWMVYKRDVFHGKELIKKAQKGGENVE